MAVRPEVVAQLARMLGDPALRSASDDGLRAEVDSRFDRLVEALVSETAECDDVTDGASAIAYVDSRLETLALVLSPDQVERLRLEVAAVTEKW